MCEGGQGSTKDSRGEETVQSNFLGEQEIKGLIM